MIILNNNLILGIKLGNSNVKLCIGNTELYSPVLLHDYVEIGGVKWATMNIGAESITDPGIYFLWGDIQGYTAEQVGVDKTFNWNSYKYTNDGGATMSKYNSTDNLTVLLNIDDAASVYWGNGWRMPTVQEFISLGDNTTLAWTGNYLNTGISGAILTDRLDSSKVLFFPSTGWCSNLLSDVNDGVYFHTSSLSGNISKSNYVSIRSYWVHFDYYDDRYYGYPIRPVKD